MSDRSVTGVDIDDRMKTVLRTEAAIRTSAIAAGFVTTSVHTWLKVPDLDDLEAVGGATRPRLGGGLREDQDTFFETWRSARPVSAAVETVVRLCPGASVASS